MTIDRGTIGQVPSGISIAARGAGLRRLGLFVVGVSVASVWAVATSAGWTDTVSMPAPGPDGGPLVSSSFGIEQRTVASSGAVGQWSGSGAADPSTALPFGVDASLLEPGDAVYAGLEIRTTARSLPGEVAVGGATPVGPTARSAGLWDDLRVRAVAVSEEQAGNASCGPGAFDPGGGPRILEGSLATAGQRPVAVEGAGSGAVLLCFEVRLAADAKPAPSTVDVAWAIDAESGS
jgi:hypothetical protein